MIRNRANPLLAVLLGLWAWCGAVQAIGAQQSPAVQSADRLETRFQYTVGIACPSLAPRDLAEPSAQTYSTEAHIGNLLDRPVAAGAKIALSPGLDTGTEPVRLTPYGGIDLAAGAEIELGCGDIPAFFCPAGGVCIDIGPRDGILIVKSPEAMSVVRIDSVRYPDGEVQILDSEPVAPQEIAETVILAASPPPPEEPPSDRLCGIGLGLTCPAGQYCDLGLGHCRDTYAPGVCRPRPDACTMEYRPVCGCDGETYSNACAAASAGVSIDYEGACRTLPGPSG